ncbi:hypothetical protein K466DRAFT_586411 [Polyporus arcularius HHB13444]|uniref:Defect at low temperature protein 1 n=1 Tax=Polyporus arcularius HHB13444 TaxID=1314778 RepID=A0A5C3PFQ7_9APHY|nr:hypothetical protein K466DRAFT_586411 [Polyporus arcularius HHB13444]
MAWTAYLAIFSLSFVVSALTARSNTVATQTRWTTATPLIPILSPTLFVVSALALILAALFGTVHTILYWNATISGDDALIHRVRRAGGRVFKAVLCERACRVLRAVVGVSSIPRRDILENRSVMEVFDYRVWRGMYYLLVSTVQTGVVVLFRIASRRADVVSEEKLDSVLLEPIPGEVREPELPATSVPASSDTRTLYNLSILGHFFRCSGRLAHLPGDQGTTERLYTTVVDICQLTSADLTVDLHGVTHSLPNVDLHALANTSKERSGPVQLRLPVPVKVEDSSPAERVVIFVVLAPLRREEESTAEDVEELEDAQSRALAAGGVASSALYTTPEGSHPDHDPSVDEPWWDVDVFSPSSNTTSTSGEDHDSLSAAARQNEHKSLTRGRDSSGEKFLDTLRSFSAVSTSSSSVVSCLSTPSHSTTSLNLRPLDLNAPVFVPRSMRLQAAYDSVGFR